MNKIELYQLNIKENISAGRLCSKIYCFLKTNKNAYCYLSNFEKVGISGNLKKTKEEYFEKIKRGSRYHGPFYPRTAPLILKRIYRGMTNYTTTKGKQIYERFYTYGDKNQLLLRLRKNNEVEEKELVFEQKQSCNFQGKFNSILKISPK